MNGSQTCAEETLKFLKKNEAQHLVQLGFTVGIARIAKQEEVWIEYGRKTVRVTVDSKLRRRKR